MISKSLSSVWILTINNSAGTQVYACSTKEVADAVAYAYVVENWVDTMQIPMPDDRDVAVDTYFGANGFNEDRTITEETVISSFEEGFAKISTGVFDTLLAEAKDPETYDDGEPTGSFDTILPDLGMYLKGSLPLLTTPEDLYHAGDIVTYEYLGDLRRLGMERNGDMTEFMFRASRTIQSSVDGGTSRKENDVRVCLQLEEDEEHSLKTPISDMLSWDKLQEQLELYLGGED